MLTVGFRRSLRFFQKYLQGRGSKCEHSSKKRVETHVATGKIHIHLKNAFINLVKLQKNQCITNTGKRIS